MSKSAHHEKVEVFEQHAADYEEWFEAHPHAYRSELKALEKAMPDHGRGLEIGVGTARFAEPLGIKEGVEPAEAMARIAEQRGITVYHGYAEGLPFKDGTFSHVLMVTTVCFLADIPKAFSEAFRVLEPGGVIVLGIIDRESELGRKHEANKDQSRFYRRAHFHSTTEISTFLKMAGFEELEYWQTLSSGEPDRTEEPEEGFGKGSFVVIRGRKGA